MVEKERILYHTIPYYTVLYRTIPYHTVLYRTIPDKPYSTIPYNTRRKRTQCTIYIRGTQRQSLLTPTLKLGSTLLGHFRPPNIRLRVVWWRKVHGKFI